MKIKVRRKKKKLPDGYGCITGKSEDEKLSMRIEVLESKHIGLDGLVCKHVADIARLGKTADQARHYLRTSVDYVAMASKNAQRAEAMMEDNKRELDKYMGVLARDYKQHVSDTKDMITKIIPGRLEKLGPYAFMVILVGFLYFMFNNMMGVQQRYVADTTKDLKEYVQTATKDLKELYFKGR